MAQRSTDLEAQKRLQEERAIPDQSRIQEGESDIDKSICEHRAELGARLIAHMESGNLKRFRARDRQEYMGDKAEVPNAKPLSRSQRSGQHHGFGGHSQFSFRTPSPQAVPAPAAAPGGTW